jgi:hypothetical protein
LTADAFTLIALSEDSSGVPSSWRAVAAYGPGDRGVQIGLAGLAVELCDAIVLGVFDDATTGAIGGDIDRATPPDKRASFTQVFA